MSRSLNILISCLMLSYGQLVSSKEVLKTKISSILGHVKCNGKAINISSAFPANCQLSTDLKSNIFLEFQSEGLKLAFGPESDVKIERGESGVSLVVSHGMMRLTNNEDLNKSIDISSINASIVLAGGDRLLRVSKTFGETEIINLSGSSKMISTSESSDFIVLNNPVWAGIGGRFGKKFGDLYKLNKEQAEFYSRLFSQ